MELLTILLPFTVATSSTALTTEFIPLYHGHTRTQIEILPKKYERWSPNIFTVCSGMDPGRQITCHLNVFNNLSDY